jgi:allantoate deiminase
VTPPGTSEANREPDPIDNQEGRALDAVSEERIAARIAELATIGGLANRGVTRLGLTVEEQAARDLVRSWLAPLDFACRQDGAGNLYCGFGDPPRVLLGSHLDSVREGGRFDGALGVVMAVEVAEAAFAVGLDLPLEVAAWQGEEGVRFGVGLFGSASVTGLLPDGAWELADREGATAREAATALFGHAPDDGRDLLDRSALRAYLEPHMEQSSTLDAAGRPLGVVTRIVGLDHGLVTVEGRADHAGATRMEDRQDALAAAAECILAVERLSREAQGRAIATVGEVEVLPNAPNVVPGRCVLSLDTRSAQDEARDALLGAIRDAVEAIAAGRGERAEVASLGAVPAQPLDPDVVSALDRACRAIGQVPEQLVSRAAHDAQNLARFGIPTGMLFVRSTHGSHNPAEHVEVEDAALGVRALLLTSARLGRLV